MQEDKAVDRGWKKECAEDEHHARLLYQLFRKRDRFDFATEAAQSSGMVLCATCGVVTESRQSLAWKATSTAQHALPYHNHK